MASLSKISTQSLKCFGLKMNKLKDNVNQVMTSHKRENAAWGQKKKKRYLPFLSLVGQKCMIKSRMQAMGE